MSRWKITVQRGGLYEEFKRTIYFHGGQGLKATVGVNWDRGERWIVIYPQGDVKYGVIATYLMLLADSVFGRAEYNFPEDWDISMSRLSDADLTLDR